MWASRSIADDVASLQRRLEVRDVLSELVEDVCEWWREDEAWRSRSQAQELHQVAVTLAKRVQALQGEKQGLKGEMSAIKERAKEVRAKFAVDVAAILEESRGVQSLRLKIKDLEAKLASRSNVVETAPAQAETTASVVVASIPSVASSANAPAPASTPEPTAVALISESALPPLPAPLPSLPPPPPPPRRCILSDVSDGLLLGIFSYLQTGEVLAAAQANRFVFQRVDGLFGIDSKIAMPAWGERYPEPLPTSVTAGNSSVASPNSQAAPAVPSAAASFAAGTISALASIATGAQASSKERISSLLSFIEGTSGGAHPSTLLLPRELLDALGKKLSAPELKAVAALNDSLRRQIAEADKTTAEKDDLAARLHNTETVRDFLVSKLRAAELALKAAMSEAAQLRRQSLADGEVISYLDLKGQELEAQTTEAEQARHRLQSSLSFQQGSFAHTERRLSTELAELRARLDEAEAAFRAQKKLLVKEVKLLRSQLDVTTKERNVFGAQLRVVKDALL